MIHRYLWKRYYQVQEIHGLSRTPAYGLWSRLKHRRKLCARWSRSFTDFFLDVGPRPSSDHKLNLIDMDGAYHPDNVCGWVTKEEIRCRKRVIAESKRLVKKAAKEEARLRKKAAVEARREKEREAEKEIRRRENWNAVLEEISSRCRYPKAYILACAGPKCNTLFFVTMHKQNKYCSPKCKNDEYYFRRQLRR